MTHRTEVIQREGKSDIALTYDSVPLGTLIVYTFNARVHTRKQLRKLKHSISAFGFLNPILADENSVVIAGHGRLEAAKELGLDKVSIIRISGLSENEKIALRIADNRIAEDATWKSDLLVHELTILDDSGGVAALTLTGMDTVEFDTHLDLSPGSHEPDPLDQVPETIRDKPAVSKPGMLLILGRHKLFVGDATKAESYKVLLGDEVVHIVIIDPPYNVRARDIGGLGKTKHGNFVMASGDLSKTEFTGLLKTTCQYLVRFSKPGSIHYIFMDWRHQRELLDATQDVYTELKNVCVWVKNNGGMGTFYRSKHELVFVFKNGTAPHTNTFELGQNGRYRTNVWEYAGVNTFRAGRDDELAMHLAVLEVGL